MLDTNTHKPITAIPNVDVLPGYDTGRLINLAAALPQISTVLLDQDGVILDDCHLLEIAVCSLIHLGVALPQEQIVVEGKLRAPHSRLDKNILHLANTAGCNVGLDCVTSAIAASVSEVKARYGGSLPEQSCLASEAISQLGERYRLGLVTSRERADVTRILAALAIEDFLSVVITKEDVKTPKPDPEGLLKALERIRSSNPELLIKPGNCVYIGDMHTDMRAAVAAGMHAIGVIAPMDRAAANIAAEELYKAGAAVVLPTADRFLDIKEIINGILNA